MASAFSGMSMLRKKEEESSGPKPLSEKAKQMQEYLAQQYGGGSGGGAEKPKKKKKVKKASAIGAVRIMDNDVTGFSTNPDDRMGRKGDVDEDQPVIANAEEAEVLRHQAERERELLGKKSGGSGGGWAVIEEVEPPVARRARHDSPEGASPLRRRAREASPDDASPPRRRARHDSPQDASPPRRPAAARHDSSPDASPPRRPARHDSSGDDASPPRRRARHDSPQQQGGDASPPRRPNTRNNDSSPDASPPRRSNKDAEDLSPPRRKPGGTGTGTGTAGEGPQFMSDGAVAGMVSGRELMQEMAKKRELEKKRFAELDPTLTGQAAQTVFRDASGRAVSKDEYLEAKAAERKANKATYDAESELAWGGGLKQQAEREAQEERMREEAALPFARGHDARLEAEQKERLRWGDPMAHLVKKKVQQLDAPAGLVEGQVDRLKKSGFIIPLEVPGHSWMRRGVGAPPNRYGIKPGRHWDGVDRSNGFERDMFKRQTELKRRNEEARMWAQGDM